MGTRGALGFKYNGEYKLAYNHWDSYPGGLGTSVVDFCRDTYDEDGKYDIDDFKKKVGELVLVGKDSKPTKEQIERYKHYADTSVSTRSLDEWYVLLRGLQGVDTLAAVRDGEIGHMESANDFVRESLFCEYAYIINLDDDTIEFFLGYQTEPQRDNPFGTKHDDGDHYDGSHYYPVRLMGASPLNNIPIDWEQQFYPSEEDEED